MRLRAAAAALLLMLVFVAPADTRSVGRAPTRYSLAGGCYRMMSSSGAPVAPADAPYRLQAAALGQYLLYGIHRDYLGARLTPVSSPGPATVWRVNPGARSMTDVGAGKTVPVSFEPASGCAVYPEAQVDATGPAFKGASPEAAVLGTVEGHAHITAFELFGGDWHCGRLWSPYGAPYALPASCAPEEQGTNGAVESFLDFGGPTRPSDMHGWPTFREWPSPTALAEEGDYWTAIERAWKAGLRVLVTNLVDNEALCSLMTKRHNPCNDMASVRIQSHDLYGAQNYIDAQSGGPGKGWFRIVTNPFQARRVINEGKLAVVEGIEVSRIFGCGEMYDKPQCGPAQIDAGLKEVHALGVRTFFPIHEFDNAFGGTKMIAGETGVIVNAGNRDETGSFWTLQPCPAQDQDAEQLTTPPTGALAGLLNGPVAKLLHGNPLPIYGSGPQCNVRGLTNLGAYVIKQMIKQHFVIQTDHMDSKSASAAVAIAAAQHYSGVVSAHCCSSPQLFRRIYSIGGFVNPPVQPAMSLVTTWKRDRALRSGKYAFGFGYGSDENGLAEQPGPSPATPISYPFKSFDGRVTFGQEQWGVRKFNLNTDGLANYGMYADWLHELQVVGGRPLMSDMFNGAEAYLEMWERAYGVPGTRCLPAHGTFGRSGVGRLRLGRGATSLLYAAGQPVSRSGRSYRYCVSGAHGQPVRVVFGAGGKVELIVSLARGYRAGRSVGARLLRGRGFVGVAAPAVARSPRLLASDLRAAGV